MENWTVSVILFRSLTLMHRHVRHWNTQPENHESSGYRAASSRETLDVGTLQGSQFTPPSWPNTPQIQPTPTGPAQLVPPHHKTAQEEPEQPGAKTRLIQTWLTTLTRYGPMKHNRVWFQGPVSCGWCQAHMQLTAPPQSITDQHISGSFQFRYIRHTVASNHDISVMKCTTIHFLPFNSCQWAKVGSTLDQHTHTHSQLWTIYITS